jgi:hypothetical protein
VTPLATTCHLQQRPQHITLKIRECKRTCNTILAGFQLWSKSTKTYKWMATLLPCLVFWELHATSTFSSQKTSKSLCS